MRLGLKLMFTNLKKFLKKTYREAPQRRKVLYAPFVRIYKRCRLFYYVKIKNIFRTTYLSIYVIEGTDQTGNFPLVLGFAGKDVHAQAYWTERAFSSGCKKHFIGKCWFWETHEFFKKSRFDCDMLLIKTNWLTEKFYSRKPGFKIPIWMQMGIDITRPEEILKKKPGDRRRIRKYNLTYEIGKKPEQFNDFYYNMYLPQTKKRHKDAAEVYEYDYFKDIFSRSEILFVKKEGTPLAGTLIEYRKGKVKLSVGGVKDGNIEYLKYGIDAASYYYAAMEMRKKNYKYMDVGEVRPILRDGLTQFKISLGAEIRPRYFAGKEHLRLILLKDSPGLKIFLEQNPFVYYSKKQKPFRAIFWDDNRYASEIKLKRDLKTANCKGLVGTHLFTFGEKEKVAGWLGSMGESTSCIKPAKDYILSSY